MNKKSEDQLQFLAAIGEKISKLENTVKIDETRNQGPT